MDMRVRTPAPALPRLLRQEVKVQGNSVKFQCDDSSRKSHLRTTSRGREYNTQHLCILRDKLLFLHRSGIWLECQMDTVLLCVSCSKIHLRGTRIAGGQARREATERVQGDVKSWRG